MSEVKTRTNQPVTGVVEEVNSAIENGDIVIPKAQYRLVGNIFTTEELLYGINFELLDSDVLIRNNNYHVYIERDMVLLVEGAYVSFETFIDTESMNASIDEISADSYALYLLDNSTNEILATFEL